MAALVCSPRRSDRLAVSVTVVRVATSRALRREPARAVVVSASRSPAAAYAIARATGSPTGVDSRRAVSRWATVAHRHMTQALAPVQTCPPSPTTVTSRSVASWSRAGSRRRASGDPAGTVARGTAWGWSTSHCRNRVHIGQPAS